MVFLKKRSPFQKIVKSNESQLFLKVENKIFKKSILIDRRQDGRVVQGTLHNRYFLCCRNFETAGRFLIHFGCLQNFQTLRANNSYIGSFRKIFNICIKSSYKMQHFLLGCAAILAAAQPLKIVFVVVVVLLLCCCCCQINFYNWSFDVET